MFLSLKTRTSDKTYAIKIANSIINEEMNPEISYWGLRNIIKTKNMAKIEEFIVH